MGKGYNRGDLKRKFSANFDAQANNIIVDGRRILMKKTLAIIFVLLISQISTVYAYTITAVDDELFCFEESSFEKDSHRYKSIFEVSEKEGTITAKQDTDLNSGESYEGNRVFKIAVTPALQPVVYKKSLKGVYINEKTGGIEIIDFCEDGTFLWVRVQDNYVNMSSGKYVSDKKF
jgi:hypothetical protein